MLADKQAYLEKLEWEVKTSNKKVEDLQGDVSNMEFEISSLMTLFEKILENVSSDCYDGSIPSYELEALQSVVSNP
jgi:chromosome segregation ATPase